MNANAKKWVEALRSGEYKQGTGALQIDNHYCCLGVACEVFRQETGTGTWDHLYGAPVFRTGIPDDLGSPIRLPNVVREWLGLTGLEGLFKGNSLVDMNDKYTSFTEIADVIESEPAGLFE